MKKPKKGERYLNHLGEYVLIKSVYRDIVKIQIAGKNARPEIWKLEDFLNDKIGRFYKVPYPRINRTNVARHLVEFQLNLIGKTTADAKKLKNWYDVWTITEEDYDVFKHYSLYTLKKIFKFNKAKAESTFSWFMLQFGLKITPNKKI